MQSKTHIIGIGDTGIDGITAMARSLIEQADLLVGDAETLARVPASAAARVAIGDEMAAAVDAVQSRPEGRIVVLASGDPLFYGVARYLCEKLGKDRFEVVPHVSSMQLAFARVKESWEEAYLTNLANHPIESVVEKTREAEKVGLFTTEVHPPSVVARALLDSGVDYFSAYVCENLGSPDERVTAAELADLVDQSFAPLNVMILVRKPELPDRPSERVGRRLFGNPDTAFLQSKPKAGLLTPAEVRSAALAELDLGPGSIVWDVGAGSGSLAIEAAQIAAEGRTYAIEVDADDHHLTLANAERFEVENLVAILGRAPDAWASLPDPDAIFIGGVGREIHHLVEAAFGRLRPGGRLVVNVAAIESVGAVHAAMHRVTPRVNVLLINVARGTYQLERIRFDALNPTFLLAAVR